MRNIMQIRNAYQELHAMQNALSILTVNRRAHLLVAVTEICSKLFK